MQTNIPKEILNTYAGERANEILRNCVHCGFCTATCPTYQILGDELDSPRGRIYLIKQMLEGNAPTQKTMTHLDRCLTCRSCETTCPSGVKYAQLLDIGRKVAEDNTRRSIFDTVKRGFLHAILYRPTLFRFLYSIALKFNPLLPAKYRVLTPGKTDIKPANKELPRKVLLLQGCVQPTLQPNINPATEKLLNHLGIQVTVLKQTQCCGAISHHLNKHKQADKTFKDNIDAWWPYLNDGYEAIVSNASGCGITLKEYVSYLEHDSEYADKAKFISSKVKDICELISGDDLEKLPKLAAINVAFHAPCTLQHGLRLATRVEDILQRVGIKLLPVKDSHLCCGSAGTYSILQAKISTQLKQRKLENLTRHSPEYIITANIGCQQHLQQGNPTPVKHWVELLAEAIDDTSE